jgi:small conductance mechanosensitive channel
MSEKTVALLFQWGEVLLTVLIGWILIKIFLHIERKTLEKTRLDGALHLFILRASKICLWLILIIAVAPKLGVSAASLVAVLGAGGAAIALALKDSLGNVAGGIIILMTKPFGRGDTIEVAGTCGVVDSIDLLTTQLHTFDNKAVTVPNGTITTSVVTNYSREEYRRVDCQFGIGYSADIGKAKEILREVARSSPLVMEAPAPLIGVAEHGDHAVLLDLKVWCQTADYFDVKYYLEEQVKLAFDQAGIDIPYHQVDIHMIH